MTKKQMTIVLVVLAVIAIGVFAYLQWWNRTEDHGVLDEIPAVQQASDSASKAVVRPAAPKPAPVVNPGTEGSPEVPSTTYRTFENNELAFSFAYPDNWSVSQTKRGDRTEVCLRTEGGTGPCLVTVVAEKESVNASAEKALKAFEGEFHDGNVSESSRRIGGVEADVLKVGGYPAGKENSTRAAVFVEDGYVYSIESEPGQEAIFDRVADSFLFRM
jgi:hypothetical protein